MVTEEERGGDLFPALHVSLMSSDESDTEDNALTTRPICLGGQKMSETFLNSCIKEQSQP